MEQQMIFLAAKILMGIGLTFLLSSSIVEISNFFLRKSLNETKDRLEYVRSAVSAINAGHKVPALLYLTNLKKQENGSRIEEYY
jgi:hypothetical protein